MDQEITIYLNEETIKAALNGMEKNNKFLLLNGNLFSIENIVTCFNVDTKFSNNIFTMVPFYYFKFSYNDSTIKKLINVKVICEDDTVYGFLKTSNYMDNEQLNLLVNKVEKFVEDENNVQVDSLNNNLYNEALIFVTSGINNSECKNVKDDFESKFKCFYEKQKETNDNLKILITKLYNNLINIKIGG